MAVVTASGKRKEHHRKRGGSSTAALKDLKPPTSALILHAFTPECEFIFFSVATSRKNYISNAIPIGIFMYHLAALCIKVQRTSPSKNTFRNLYLTVFTPIIERHVGVHLVEFLHFETTFFSEYVNIVLAHLQFVLVVDQITRVSPTLNSYDIFFIRKRAHSFFLLLLLVVKHGAH